MINWCSLNLNRRLSLEVRATKESSAVFRRASQVSLVPIHKLPVLPVGSGSRPYHTAPFATQDYYPRLKGRFLPCLSIVRLVQTGCPYSLLPSRNTLEMNESSNSRSVSTSPGVWTRISIGKGYGLNMRCSYRLRLCLGRSLSAITSGSTSLCIPAWFRACEPKRTTA